MKIRVLGCYGSRLPGFHTSSFLINDSVLLDAGTIASLLSIEEQAAIDHIVLTHAHLDHVVDIAFLVDNVFTLRTEPLRIWGPPPVLASVQRYLFNNDIWPDFTRIVRGGKPAVELCSLGPSGTGTLIGNLTLHWAETNHVVFTAGYCLTDKDARVLLSGDTAATEQIWQLGQGTPSLSLAFVETSFPNRLQSLADASGHLTPAALGSELAKLGMPHLPVKIFHLKPQFLEEITQELEALYDPRLQILRGGEVFII